ncbi:hypothetical protein [Spiroplasma sp. AdecLV25b]|uniref:hypothetical protein n=1 Tax=Spiroplasma sp. AdecLV25b TaxID=3027162 RepID=UPI0027DF6C22|nr:hypothetical protein [Spiroplasma sp. AdecLV25b]
MKFHHYQVNSYLDYKKVLLFIENFPLEALEEGSKIIYAIFNTSINDVSDAENDKSVFKIWNTLDKMREITILNRIYDYFKSSSINASKDKINNVFWWYSNRVSWNIWKKYDEMLINKKAELSDEFVPNLIQKYEKKLLNTELINNNSSFKNHLTTQQSNIQTMTRYDSLNLVDETTLNDTLNKTRLSPESCVNLFLQSNISHIK